MSRCFTSCFPRSQMQLLGASIVVLSTFALGSPPHLSAQSSAVRTDGYIAVLNALQQTADETFRVCNSTKDSTSCGLAKIAVEAFQTGVDSVKRCRAGDQEACAVMDQAAALLGYQSTPEPSMPSPWQPGGPSVPSPFGGGGAMGCDDYRVQYETCKAQVRSFYGPYRPGAISQHRAANAQCRAILEAAAAVCQGGGGGSGGGGGTCLDRCRQYSFQESRCTPEHPDGNVYAGGPSRAGDRENCRNAAIRAQEDCLRSCR